MIFAIETKFHGPTNYKGTRLSAKASGKQVFIGFPYGLEGIAAHIMVMAAFLAEAKMFFNLTAEESDPANWVGGWTKNGYAFVYVGKQRGE